MMFEVQVVNQEWDNEGLQQCNDVLVVEVKDFKEGQFVIEECVCSELGMIKFGEKFYCVVEDVLVYLVQFVVGVSVQVGDYLVDVL